MPNHRTRHDSGCEHDQIVPGVRVHAPEVDQDDSKADQEPRCDDVPRLTLDKVRETFEGSLHERSPFSRLHNSRAIASAFGSFFQMLTTAKFGITSEPGAITSQ